MYTCDRLDLHLITVGHRYKGKKSKMLVFVRKMISHNHVKSATLKIKHQPDEYFTRSTYPVNINLLLVGKVICIFI